MGGVEFAERSELSTQLSPSSALRFFNVLDHLPQVVRQKARRTLPVAKSWGIRGKREQNAMLITG